MREPVWLHGSGVPGRAGPATGGVPVGVPVRPESAEDKQDSGEEEYASHEEDDREVARPRV
jgi:hypothetical protein